MGGVRESHQNRLNFGADFGELIQCFENAFIGPGEVSNVGAVFDGRKDHAAKREGSGFLADFGMHGWGVRIFGRGFPGVFLPKGQGGLDRASSGIAFRLSCPKDLVAFLDHGK